MRSLLRKLMWRHFRTAARQRPLLVAKLSWQLVMGAFFAPFVRKPNEKVQHLPRGHLKLASSRDLRVSIIIYRVIFHCRFLLRGPELTARCTIPQLSAGFYLKPTALQPHTSPVMPSRPCRRLMAVVVLLSVVLLASPSSSSQAVILELLGLGMLMGGGMGWLVHGDLQAQQVKEIVQLADSEMKAIVRQQAEMLRNQGEMLFDQSKTIAKQKEVIMWGAGVATLLESGTLLFGFANHVSHKSEHRKQELERHKIQREHEIQMCQQEEEHQMQMCQQEKEHEASIYRWKVRKIQAEWCENWVSLASKVAAVLALAFLLRQLVSWVKHGNRIAIGNGGPMALGRVDEHPVQEAEVNEKQHQRRSLRGKTRHSAVAPDSLLGS
eukprot:Skav222027  [mRNA]  locus=scaffold2914:213203:221031:+ [translate_table: standard]